MARGAICHRAIEGLDEMERSRCPPHLDIKPDAWHREHVEPALISVPEETNPEIIPGDDQTDFHAHVVLPFVELPPNTETCMTRINSTSFWYVSSSVIIISAIRLAVASSTTS